jgi:hypothetical protein
VWTNDSFLVMRNVCRLIEDESVSALVFLHPGPALEAVSSALSYLGLPLLVVDYHLQPSQRFNNLLNFAPSCQSLGQALADLLAGESLTSLVAFYRHPLELPIFDVLVATGRLTGSMHLVKIREDLQLGKRRGEMAVGGEVVVLLSCRREEGLAFLESALLSGWLVRGSRLVLPCLDLQPQDLGRYSELGASIYLAYLDTPYTNQTLTALLTHDILTGKPAVILHH